MDLSLIQLSCLTFNTVACLMTDRIVKTEETAVARQWFSNDHMVTPPTDTNTGITYDVFYSIRAGAK
jgi:hypothetical protein